MNYIFLAYVHEFLAYQNVLQQTILNRNLENDTATLT